MLRHVDTVTFMPLKKKISEIGRAVITSRYEDLFYFVILAAYYDYNPGRSNNQCVVCSNSFCFKIKQILQNHSHPSEKRSNRALEPIDPLEYCQVLTVTMVEPIIFRLCLRLRASSSCLSFSWILRQTSQKNPNEKKTRESTKIAKMRSDRKYEKSRNESLE